MIENLSIKNFKNLQDLEIQNFGKVNLITGKNNTGKSSLLEAIALYVNDGNPAELFKILDYREEINLYNLINRNLNITLEQYNLNAIASIFTNRLLNSKIHITAKEDGILQNFALRFANYVHEHSTGNNPITKTIVDDFNPVHPNYLLGLETIKGSIHTLYYLSKDLSQQIASRPIGGTSPISYQFITSSGNLNHHYSGELWDNIILTDKEISVINALKIIEPTVERLAFKSDPLNGRRAVIKLQNIPNVFPIKSMGDGINRILHIILAAVNAENGYLLIDEFENGLHHSVQEKLWEIIFKLADELNIQVFATTHSNDCIYGFEGALNSFKDKEAKGKLIRLERKGDQIKEVSFTANELRIATNEDIEIR
ncbi:MAG: AAA family ATPase [Flammeovirgaceae bacterium]